MLSTATASAAAKPAEMTIPETPADPTESEIARVAYQLWLDRGCPHGSDQDDWFRAEEMIRKSAGFVK